MYPNTDAEISVSASGVSRYLDIYLDDVRIVQKLLFNSTDSTHPITISAGTFNINSMEDAFSDAKKKNQNVLVIVTSNGDDELSASFVDNVINDANFKSEVSSKYTVLHMDFSEATFKKTVVNPDDDKKVQEKAEKFANLMQVNAKYAS